MTNLELALRAVRARYTIVLCGLLCTLLAPSVSMAQGAKKHSVGLDAIRLIDNGQYEPDEGMMNLFYQGALTSTTAWQLGAGVGDKATVIDLGYKLYTQRYLQGTFWQLGLAYVDVRDSTVYDNDFGITGQVGFEQSPAPHLTVSIAARMMLLLEHPATGEKEPFFTPVIGIMYSF